MAGKVVAVILAAGASRRMGAPKLAMPVGERALLEWAIAAARESRADGLLVVTGADAATLEPVLTRTGAARVHNEAWATGLSASLRSGLEAADAEDASALLLLLGDQPDVTPELLNALIARHEDGAPVVACRYADGTAGPPALFGRSEFQALRALEGDQGARPLLDRAPERVAFVDFPAGNDDVDRPQDIARAARRLG